MLNSIFNMFGFAKSDNLNIVETDPVKVKQNIQNKMLINDQNDLNMFVSYRGVFFKGSILSSVCATIGLSSLTLMNIAPNIVPNIVIPNKVKLVPVGMFIVAGSLNLLFNQLDNKLEIQQKKLLNKYNIDTETYVDQNTLNDIPAPTIPQFNQSQTQSQTQSQIQSQTQSN